MNMVPNCKSNSIDELDLKLQNEGWEKSISMPKFIGWRRPQDDNSGIFEYKSVCFTESQFTCFDVDGMCGSVTQAIIDV